LRGGPKNIDLQEAKSLGIKITNTPGKTARAVAESTLAGLMALTRNIVRGSWGLQKENVWEPVFFRYEHCGIELAGKTFGLIGFGHIAKELTGLLSGFQLKKILAFDPFADGEEIKKCGATSVDLSSLLAKSDIISLHARLNASSRNLIGESQFEAMAKQPVFINTARGGLVNYRDLIRALEKKRLSGAVLDVFGDEEFLEYSDLMNRPNVVCTPHIAGGSRETVKRAALMVAEDIRCFVTGNRLQHRI
jgi:D-3-phosphoglycerate dehydrogenase